MGDPVILGDPQRQPRDSRRPLSRALILGGITTFGAFMAVTCLLLIPDEDRTKFWIKVEETIFGPSYPHVADSYNHLGRIRYDRKDYLGAQDNFKRALRIREATLGAQHPLAIQALYNLGLSALKQQDAAGAASAFAEAAERARHGPGVNNKEGIEILMNLGAANTSLARFAAAEQDLSEALSISEKLHPANNPATTAVLERLANCYTLAGRNEKATLVRQRLATIGDALAIGSSGDFAALHRSGWQLSEQGRHGEAASRLEAALAAGERSLGPDNQALAPVLYNLAYAYYNLHNYERCELLLKRELKILESGSRDDQRQAHSAQTLLAHSHFAQERYLAAKQMYVKILPGAEKWWGASNPHTTDILQHLGECYWRLRAFDEADRTFKEKLRRCQALHQGDSLGAGDALVGLALSKRQQGRFAAAAAYFERALAMRQRLLAANSIEIIRTMTALAEMYDRIGRFGDAERLLLQALELRQVIAGREQPRPSLIAQDLSRLLRKLNKHAQADQLEAVYKGQP